MAKDLRVTIWTDSKYVFGVAHAHAGIWRERGMITAQGEPVKYGEQIQAFLQAIQEPKEVAIVHCRAHQRGDGDVTRGNARADREAKRVANTEDIALLPLIPTLPDPHEKPEYSAQEQQLAEQLQLNLREGWFVRDNQPIPLDQPLHTIQPGDSILLRTWKEEPLQKKWKGPHLVLLTTKTAAKLEGVKPWVHFTRLKKVEPAEEKEWTASCVTPEAKEDLRLKLLFKY
ncbi:uncharacterized protein LOC142019732 [Carettochelys insculpta]|uniref:uncharacterized protein LOC142019732 n=1 Tax=Carettochelys insculpta TaxID=44489 RepID=UPI003EBF9609